MREILIYGGSFSPIHNGHDAIIRYCASLNDYSGVWIMPSARRKDKPFLLSDSARLYMLRQYWRSLPPEISKCIKVSDFEIRIGEPSETLRTDTALRQKYSKTRFTYVFGSDSFNGMKDWNGGQELYKRLNILVVARSGHDVPANYKGQYIILPNNCNISSTIIRERLCANKRISHLVPASVLELIQSHYT